MVCWIWTFAYRLRWGARAVARIRSSCSLWVTERVSKPPLVRRAAASVSMPAGPRSPRESQLGRPRAGTYGLAVELVVSIPGLDHDTAMTVAQAAHKICPYSNAIRDNVDVSLVVQ